RLRPRLDGPMCGLRLPSVISLALLGHQLVERGRGDANFLRHAFAFAPIFEWRHSRQLGNPRHMLGMIAGRFWFCGLWFLFVRNAPGLASGAPSVVAGHAE